MRLVVRMIVALAFSAALLCSISARQVQVVLAAIPPSVNLSAQNTAPREMEDSTQKAVVRDYAAAWQAMNTALDQNRPDLLAANFIGTANDKLAETIKEQKQSGLRQRFVDNGHQVQAVFYSSEGSAIELRDTAQLRIELLDGDKVVHSEDVTVHYVALLTAAENSWKVRVLQAVPAF